jgi:aminopeptidase-like protein
MKAGSLKDRTPEELTQLGREMHRFASELYPICRSITGDGIRMTLAKIAERIPMVISEIPSGTSVFDWTVPKEWNIRDAYIKNLQGERVVDFQQHNLHVMNYSVPVHATLSLAELLPHLHTLPDYPDWIPYRTSYYREDWAFCLTRKQMLGLVDADYEVCINSSLEVGTLTYGECYLPGQSAEEILISCHVCHPSLANDNLSGLAVATKMAELLAPRELHYSYRFLFIPGTIGSITWLARNQKGIDKIRHGVVLTCLGDASGFHYKKSRSGDAEIDRAVAHVLKHGGEAAEILEFSPYGYDERQYCSPGFDLSVGCLMRSKWGTFPEYHTSADNLDFIHPQQLAGALQVCLSVCDLLERNNCYLNQNPFCEPQLGKRNLYRSTGGADIDQDINARLWVLNQSDGKHSLLDIAERSGLAFATIADAAKLLQEAGLLTEVVCTPPGATQNQSPLNISVG